MDINDLRSIVTVVSLLTFLGIVWWAYGAKGNKKRFEEAAMLPFTDEEADRAELGQDRNGQRKAS
ncbi:MAG: Cbb3-type cytochrome oxidase, subunit 3 [Candidatus Accumulibacter sp. BA-94]|uniref:cbb3-type cytochrome oxidase subunit 3 n=1 Tax=Accumulibacter sp. TaxID=2053492 RepID=UPI000445D3CD|nr:cbb3-type cytochrome c oxidase subunit 3 [Accumulibacter sp.]EXI78124.1 MAG: Cbb3-type cytochrome oxidase, subunit 3 [Candidatus Accumulibacter sp. BA-94]HRD90034.1 cbb3-type cytochrome c oxidase subunit 3 [Accumulibacter sp.]